MTKLEAFLRLVIFTILPLVIFDDRLLFLRLDHLSSFRCLIIGHFTASVTYLNYEDRGGGGL